MSLRHQLQNVLSQEDLNFLLTNRLPRRWLTQLIGQVLQKCVHRTHDVRMRIKGSARKTNVGRCGIVKALHPGTLTAYRPNGKPTSQCFAIGDHICLHTEIRLGSGGRQTSRPHR